MGLRQKYEDWGLEMGEKLQAKLTRLPGPLGRARSICRSVAAITPCSWGERDGATLVQRQHLLDQRNPACVARRVGKVDGAIEIVRKARITGSR